MRLLIVELDSSPGSDFAAELSDPGDEILTCGDLATASRLIQESPVDAALVAIDRHEPAVTEWLRSLADLPAMPFVSVIVLPPDQANLRQLYLDDQSCDLICTYRDARLAREQCELMHQHQRRSSLPTLADALPQCLREGVILFDHDMRVATCDDRAKALLGLTSECAGQRFADLFRECHWHVEFDAALRRAKSPFDLPAVSTLILMPLTANPGSPLEFTLVPLTYGDQPGAIAILHLVANHDAEKVVTVGDASLRRALSTAGMNVWNWDLVTGVLSWAEGTELLAGVTPGRHTYTIDSFIGIVHPDDRASTRAAIQSTLELGDHYDHCYRVLTDSDDIRWCRAIGHLVRDAVDGTPLRMIGIAHDITIERQYADALREGEERFRGAFENAAAGMALVSPDGRFLRVNSALCELLGYSESELLEGTFQTLTHPDDLSADLTLVHRVLRGEIESFQLEKRYIRRDGQIVWAILSVSLVHDAVGQPHYFVSQVQDITARKEQQAALQLAYRQIDRIVNSVSDCIYSATISADGVYSYDYFSNVAEKLLGHPASFFSQDPSNWYTIIHPEDLFRVQRELQDVRAGHFEDRVTEIRISWPDGSQRWIADRIALSPEADGSIRIDGVLTDITERKALEQELAYRALHDGLTGLPNRTLFLDRLGHALVRRNPHGDTTGVIFLDLDNFKLVNDGLGHEAGDDLLKIVAQRLRANIRPADTLSRFGGDEFVLLVEDVATPANACEIAERLIASVAEPMTIAGRPVYIGMSAGIALVGDRLCDANEVVRNADAALYRAKAAGRGRFVLFDQGMSLDALEQLQLATDLRLALEENRGLLLHYQPVFDLESGRVVACEALVRWQHPDGHMLPPDRFIPLAEETGLIGPLETWVLREACRQLRDWHVTTASLQALSISVNLSPQRCHEPDVVEQIREVLRSSGLDPSDLTLEITERVLVDEEAHRTLGALKEVGIRLAIDDFGTGYSALGYLGRIGADVLKIDRRFVAGMMESAREAAIVEAVLALGKSLGLSVTAEGIETSDQLQQLGRLGCHSGQGFHLGRPMTAEAFVSLVTSHSVAMIAPGTDRL